MFKWIGGLIDRIFAVAGALAFSQLPLFMQQYQKHLAGHVEELKLQVAAMNHAASLGGKTLQQYVMKFLSSNDIDFKNQGELMQQMVQRYHHMTESYAALKDVSIYSKPFVFIKYFDSSIAQSIWKTFEMGFSFSLEGLVFAVIGIVCGIVVFWALRYVLKALFRPHLKQSPN